MIKLNGKPIDTPFWIQAIIAVICLGVTIFIFGVVAFFLLIVAAILIVSLPVIHLATKYRRWRREIKHSDRR